MLKTSEVIIRVGEKPSGLQLRYPKIIHLIRQPAGLDFFKATWDAKSPGLIYLDNGKNSLPIKNVLSLSAIFDNEIRNEGLAQFDINTSLTTEEIMSHDEARIKLFSLLKEIHRIGWASVIPFNVPRLYDQDLFNYALRTKKSVPLGVGYVPTLNEWMKLDSMTSWEFYSNGTFLNIDFTRMPGNDENYGSGAYIVSINIKSNIEYFRGYFSPNDRRNFINLLPFEIKKMLDMRVKEEFELTKQGIHINEKYLDPEIPYSGKLK